MAVSDGFRTFALEQLGRVTPVRARNMFGGVGVYAGDLFFALMADDVLYLKVDDTSRGDFIAAGTGPFVPGGDPSQPMGYYALPPELLEDADALGPWVRKAIAVARSARSARRQPPKRGGAAR
jgi:DNA transformation protein